MEDITPGLVERITEDFRHAYDESGKIQALLEKVQKGTATYAEAQEYSLEVSRLIGKAYSKNVSSAVLPDGKMYYNIASQLIPASMDENHALVSQYATSVQKELNRKAGIGIRAQVADRSQDRIDGLVELACGADRYDDVAQKLLNAFDGFSQSVVDDTIQKNAKLHYDAGLSPKISRKAEWKCCDWCRALEGEFDYPDVPPDVYRRHERCRCTVLYDPADGKRKRQNVHTKKWTDSQERDRIETRKNTGIKSLVQELSEHPKRLASFTPESLYDTLTAEGLEVKPLMNGSLKGIPFSDGGGFKVNFEDGGLLQFHPEKGSHHGGAYYKISTGKKGLRRYDLEGNEDPNRGKS